MDKVVHFEIPAEDLERAKKFYTEVFGWDVNFMPQFNYSIVHTVEVDNTQMPKESGAINGGMLKRNNIVKNPVITINVEDIDKSMKKIESMGGKKIMDKIKVGEMGYSAYFQDTEGNVLGIWQPLNWHK